MGADLAVLHRAAVLLTLETQATQAQLTRDNNKQITQIKKTTRKTGTDNRRLPTHCHIKIRKNIQ